MYSNDATNSVNEDLQAIMAGIGILPLMSIVLFLLGAFIGEVVQIEAPPPSQWLLVPAALFPLCIGLYLRANVRCKSAAGWLTAWNVVQHEQVVDQRLKDARTVTIEDHWMKTQLAGNRKVAQNPLNQILSDVQVWGWATFFTLLPLAYMCIWYGMMVSQQT